MTDAGTTHLQIILAWRTNKWVVERNAEEVGSYAYRGHAMARVRGLVAEAVMEGVACYFLVRGKDGLWEERPCPRPWRKDFPPRHALAPPRSGG